MVEDPERDLVEYADDDARDVLRGYWHPVAASRDVADGPVSVTLLSQPIVLWRSDGAVAAFHDLCIHRGTPLSLGWVEDGLLTCAYHGWRYSRSGACVRIPSLPPDRGIPAKARATSYRVAERYGLVWVCLDEPIADIPGFPPEIGDPSFDWEVRQPRTIEANAARSIENNMDQSHFAFVHRGILAVDPQVDPIEIDDLEDGFTWTVSNPQNTLDPTGPPEMTRFRLTMPFTLSITKYSTGTDERFVIVFVGSPISSKRSTIFRISGRNVQRRTAEEEQRRQDVIFEQDRAIVESQRPEELPLDLREELHLRGPDSAAVAYRRRLVSIGVDWG
jgi:phenylpropionate dioxygenase-like ring-hydroxylating dioxygenase large terminal subunit